MARYTHCILSFLFYSGSGTSCSSKTRSKAFFNSFMPSRQPIVVSTVSTRSGSQKTLIFPAEDKRFFAYCSHTSDFWRLPTERSSFLRLRRAVLNNKYIRNIIPQVFSPGISISNHGMRPLVSLSIKSLAVSFAISVTSLKPFSASFTINNSSNLCATLCLSALFS